MIPAHVARRLFTGLGSSPPLFWPMLAGLCVVLFAGATGRQVAAAGQAVQEGSIGGLTSKFVDVKGIKTRYYDEGQGEPVVLIHGGSTAGSSTANVWARNIPGLAKRFRVLAVDRLGSGLTGNASDNEYGTQAQAQFLYEFIRALKLGPVNLVGHSAGGGVALAMAAEQPAATRTLAIIAHGAGGADRAADNPTRLNEALKTCPDQNVYEGLRCRVEKLAWHPDTFDKDYWSADSYMATLPKSRAARAAIAAQAGDAGRTARTTAYRERILNLVRNDGVLKMPVLLYLGKNDVIDWGVKESVATLKSQLGMFDVLSAKNTRVQLIVLNDSGHFMYREHPEQFNRDLASFIAFWKSNPNAK